MAAPTTRHLSEMLPGTVFVIYPATTFDFIDNVRTLSFGYGVRTLIFNIPTES